jgi:hypothetical protein
MATKTKKFIANTTWQSIATGPMTLTMNPERGFFELYVDLTGNPPTDPEPDAFLFKPVAGENYLTFPIATGDTVWVRCLRGDHPISWIQN